MMNKNEMNQYILNKLKDGTLDPNISIEIIKALNEYKVFEDDIAIIGMSCKYPNAETPEEFWSLISNGKEIVSSFPEERARDTGIYTDYSAGFMEHIGDFDAKFFKISPREAKTMHPAQRIFLEESWKALEDAGYCSPDIEEAPVGVYLGIDHSNQLEYANKEKSQDMLYTVGNMTSILASRISYILNLCGPSMVIDAACSSGLVCVHQACYAIKNGDCDMAIAGGLNIIGGIVPTKMDGLESDTGKVGVFDKHAQGTVWGEGIAMVVLKPLRVALNDNDYIYAVIKGSAINNDGSTSGITAPSADTMSEVIDKAWQRAKINPENISYIVAHAMGTVLGDPIETKALKMAFERYTSRKQFCAIGSVKSNMGHGVSVSGVSSLLTAILAMKNRKIPPNINFEEPNPFIQFQNTPLYLNDCLREWKPNGEKLLVGVDSIGFSRTNVHVILEEAPRLIIDAKRRKFYNVFVVSAKTEAALDMYIEKYIKFLDKYEIDIGDLCYSAAIGRFHFECRMAIIAKSQEELKMKLKEALGHDNVKNVYRGYYKKSSKTDDNISEIKVLNQKAKIEIQKVSCNADLGKLCEMYVKGALVPWKEIYNDMIYHKITLPTYPFQHNHFWISLEEQPIGLSKIE